MVYSGSGLGSQGYQILNMSNKTAIQELIEYFEQQLRLQRSSEIKYTTEEALVDAIQVCKNAQKTKEKEQIQSAFENGMIKESSSSRYISDLEAEKYYSQTFKND